MAKKQRITKQKASERAKKGWITRRRRMKMSKTLDKVYKKGGSSLVKEVATKLIKRDPSLKKDIAHSIKRLIKKKKKYKRAEKNYPRLQSSMKSLKGARRKLGKRMFLKLMELRDYMSKTKTERYEEAEKWLKDYEEGKVGFGGLSGIFKAMRLFKKAYEEGKRKKLAEIEHEKRAKQRLMRQLRKKDKMREVEEPERETIEELPPTEEKTEEETEEEKTEEKTEEETNK